MARSDQADLLRYRAKASALLNKFQGVIFRYEGVWVATQAGQRYEYPCLFQVKDPRKQGQPGLALADAAVARYEGVMAEDVRLLKVHPDQSRPPVGSFLQSYTYLDQTLTHFDGGTLELLEW